MTAENPFKQGDVVRLRSGGPRMTVTTADDLYGVPHVWASWFEGTKAHSGDFPAGALELVDMTAPRTTRATVRMF